MTNTSLTLRDHLQSDRFSDEIAKVLPKHITPERMTRAALTAMMRVPKLAQCDQASFFQAMLHLSQLGLEPDGRLAHLIPFDNKRRGVTEVQVIVDYKGLVELAMRSGSVSSIHCDKVCDNDVFEYDCGQVITHKINFRAPRGDAYAYVCIITRKDGTRKCEVMTRDEVEAIRQRSRAGTSGPWVTDFDEMGKKTVFRRASKWIELSSEIRKAFDIDDTQFNITQVVRDASLSRKELFMQKLDTLELTDASPEVESVNDDIQETAD